MYRITFLAGLLLFFIAIVLFADRLSFIKNGIIAKATVIELKEKVDSDNGRSYPPVFRFNTRNNEEITFKHNVYSKPPSWSIGEETKIIYYKDLPGDIVILTYFGSFGLVVILVCLALVCFCISGGYYWSRNFFNTLT
jgi:hypothetical protein